MPKIAFLFFCPYHFFVMSRKCIAFSNDSQAISSRARDRNPLYTLFLFVRLPYFSVPLQSEFLTHTTMAKKYDLKLKGTVGYWDFNQHTVDQVLDSMQDQEVHVLIDSLGGMVKDALSISSAFSAHGNVHVHYRGMNASAATVSSMGAKHISIDASALYLVHKCSFTVFEWDALNADELIAKAEEYKKLAADAEKIDITIATMYAKRCKKPIDDLKALMAENKWLSAQEALEWGFVDEVVEGGEQVRLTASVATAMASEGMPVPEMNVEADGFLAQMEKILSRVFKSFKKDDTPAAAVATAEVDESEVKQPTNNNLMKKTFVFVAAVLAAIQSSMPDANEEGKVALDEAQLDAIEDALAQAKAQEEAKAQEIAALNEQLEAAQQEIEALKAEPAVHDDKVVETGDGQPLNEELTPEEQLAATIASARKMMK